MQTTDMLSYTMDMIDIIILIYMFPYFTQVLSRSVTSREVVCAVTSKQFSAAMAEMSQLQISEIECDVSFKEGCLLLGDVCQLKVTTSGIDTPLQTTPQRQDYEDHYCAHLEAPKGVVNPGVELRMRYAVILEGPFSFPNGYRRVSSVLFFWCNNPQELQKELTIRLQHWVNVTGKGSGLCFMEANHDLRSGESCYSFMPMEGGDFDQGSGSLRLKNHFCLLCTAIDDRNECTPDRYYAVYCERGQERRICITYAVPSWLEVNLSYMQYFLINTLKRYVVYTVWLKLQSTACGVRSTCL